MYKIRIRKLKKITTEKSNYLYLEVKIFWVFLFSEYCKCWNMALSLLFFHSHSECFCLTFFFYLSLQLHFLKDLPCESLYKATSLRFSCRQTEGVSDRVEPPTPQSPSACRMQRWMYPCLPAALLSKKNHVRLIKSSSSGKLVSRNQSIIRRMETLRRLRLKPVMCPTYSISNIQFMCFCFNTLWLWYIFLRNYGQMRADGAVYQWISLLLYLACKVHLWSFLVLFLDAADILSCDVSPSLNWIKYDNDPQTLVE